MSDFAVYDLHCTQVEVDECQRMHYLQMALEKSAKAHYWLSPGATAETSRINRSHRVAEKFLPAVYKNYWRVTRGGKAFPGNTLKAVKRLCREVDLLAPAVVDGDLRQDNCEYPWEVRDAAGRFLGVRSPLDHEFAPSSMVLRPATAGFLKAIRASVRAIVADKGKAEDNFS